MKQNYKLYLCALLLVGATGMMTARAQGSGNKPTLAVLVVGLGDDYAQRMGADLNRDSEYELVTSAAAVADKLAALRAAHTASTPADTGGLAAWGRQNSIDMVQLVVETGGTKIRFLTAQLLDCNTGQLVGRGTYRLTTASKGMANPLPLPEMVPLIGGVFEMGCKSGRDDKTTTCSAAGTRTGETPVHYVRVSNFNIGKYAVTQAQWKAVMGSLPSSLTSDTLLGDDKPVIYVSWDDISGKGGYLEKLNEWTGRGYRLPTEAEWEYAARGCYGGDCESLEFSGSNTVGDVAWYSGNCPTSSPQPVGGKAPNGLGIYDMTGNVWEWCRDWWSATYYPSGTTASSPQVNPENTTVPYYPNRVFRGGNWYYDASYSRVAYRSYGNVPSTRSNFVGFRLVLP
ncbi:MAG: formylglycine-generating enzyme family protein [Prevotellaceae bacterium]|jgi:formylglycine-generating enzyme required for sulfatase activity|nr:formylglycine-generating enzyme family protein [Prevotellaceae bacterium]